MAAPPVVAPQDGGAQRLARLSKLDVSRLVLFRFLPPLRSSGVAVPSADLASLLKSLCSRAITVDFVGFLFRLPHPPACTLRSATVSPHDLLVSLGRFIDFANPPIAWTCARQHHVPNQTYQSSSTTTDF